MFEIFRLQKLKSVSDLKGSLMHALREQNTPNADPSRLHQNEHSSKEKTVIDCINKYQSKLPEKVRKDAVYAIEYLITAGDGFAETPESVQNEYLRAGHKWIADQYGEENIIYSGIHRDESTPHLSVMVIPLKDGRLNAKHFVGGSKHRLSEMQDDFHEKVGSKFGLERGLKGSKAEHIPLRQYYKQFNEFQELTQNASVDELAANVTLDPSELAPRIKSKTFFGKDVYEDVDELNERIEEKAKKINLSSKALLQKAQHAIESESSARHQRKLIDKWRAEEKENYSSKIDSEVNQRLSSQLEKAGARYEHEISRLNERLSEVIGLHNNLAQSIRNEKSKNEKLSKENKELNFNFAAKNEKLKQLEEELSLIKRSFEHDAPGTLDAKIRERLEFEEEIRQEIQGSSEVRMGAIKVEESEFGDYRDQVNAAMAEIHRNRAIEAKKQEKATPPPSKSDDYSYEP